MPDYSGISSRSDRWPYEQVAAAIEAAITSGELAPGDRLPSQDRIAAEAGVSKHTVSAAVALLRERGILHSRSRLGTFVNSPGPAGRAT
jgi:GntR family transcriptional regulator